MQLDIASTYIVDFLLDLYYSSGGHVPTSGDCAVNKFVAD